ncbi:hypothetical protein SDC9_150230 [bioreactor metagenome]|uniref:Uncharacterized protein n=1 Tax=bioreactor metagenome TaxID=1076179 RepID=A0A645EMI0_9ZZZZ
MVDSLAIQRWADRNQGGVQAGQCFGVADHQDAVVFQFVANLRKEAFLGRGIEVDHHVAQEDHVEQTD